jgi:hypothetical protein
MESLDADFDHARNDAYRKNGYFMSTRSALYFTRAQIKCPTMANAHDGAIFDRALR